MFGVRSLKNEFTTKLEEAKTLDDVTVVVTDIINNVNNFKESLQANVDRVLAFGRSNEALAEYMTFATE